MNLRNKQHICQFRVEFEDYSVAYFDCITAFEVPSDCQTSVKGRAHTRFVDTLDIHASKVP